MLRPPQEARAPWNPRGPRSGPEAPQWGRWASQNSGEGEPVLFTPDSPSPSLRGRGAFTDWVRHSLGCTGRLPGDRGLHPRSGWSSEIPPGTSSSPQAQRCVSHGLHVTWAVPHSCPSPVKRGQLEPGNTAPGAGLDFSKEAGVPAATWGELMVREGTRVLRGPGEAPLGPRALCWGQRHSPPGLPAPGESPRRGPHRVSPAGGERTSQSPGLAPEAPGTSTLLQSALLLVSGTDCGPVSVVPLCHRSPSSGETPSPGATKLREGRRPETPPVRMARRDFRG